MATYDIPLIWERRGLVLERRPHGEGSHVVGDPCTVWDEETNGWRMFLFFDPPGHGHAICRTPDDAGWGHWELLGPLVFTNPEDLAGGATHKPWIVMDPLRPNHAARIAGRYALATVSYSNGHKVIQQAWAEHLAGPWTLEKDILISHGASSDFDGNHADAVTGYYFRERDEILYFYMGYPETAQPYPLSPYGNAQGAAVQRIGERHAKKLGLILPPSDQPGHWASGWVGGLQLLPGTSHRWIAIINASPTAPSRSDSSPAREEPAPSLGGFAYCDEDWPVSGWQWCPEPIERIEAIPADARAAGEGTNLWRQHLLALPNGGMMLYYNSGSYGQEQLYLKASMVF